MHDFSETQFWFPNCPGSSLQMLSIYSYDCLSLTEVASFFHLLTLWAFTFDSFSAKVSENKC